MRKLLIPIHLEMEAQLHGFGARRDIMRAAECGEEVIKRGLVGQIDHREAQAPFVTVAMKEIVLANAGVEQAARSDALRIVIVVFLSGRGYLDEC